MVPGMEKVKNYHLIKWFSVSFISICMYIIG